MLNAKYHCTQLELYAVSRLGWANCRKQLSRFSSFKPYYTTGYIDDRIAEIAVAEKLPDIQARGEAPETDRIILSRRADACLHHWQLLKRYIADAFDEELQKTKLESAGANLYRSASRESWDVVKGLMTAGEEFIGNHLAKLSDNNNMPAGFPAEFTAVKDDFESLYETFMAAEEAAVLGTERKIAANNNVHDKLMSMLLDGQELIVKSEALHQQFVFDSLLGLVTGPGDAGVRGRVEDENNNSPLPGATVIIPDQAKSMVTDENGNFELPHLRSGNVAVKVEKPGFVTRQLEVDIPVGTITTQNMKLKPE